MRLRPIRPNIYLPVVRFGVADSDWFSVLLISCAGYLLPVPFGLTVFYVPLQMWTWLLATSGSIAFFNYIRIGRKPNWLHHKIKAVLFHHRHYRFIPNEKKRMFIRSWLIRTRSDEQSAEGDPVPVSSASTTTIYLLELNNQAQEACDEAWKEISLTTN